MNCLLVLSFAVLGASASSCGSLFNFNNGLNNAGASGLSALLGSAGSAGLSGLVGSSGSAGLSGLSGLVGSAGSAGSLSSGNILDAVTAANGNGFSGSAFGGQIPTSYYQAGVQETPTTQFPGYVPSTSASRSCHCVKTHIRPQYRNEVFTVPSVDRISRLVTSPEVDVSTVHYGTTSGSGSGSGASSGLLSGAGFGGFGSGVSGGLSGVSGGLSGVSGSLFGGQAVGGQVLSSPFVGQSTSPLFGAGSFGGVSSGVSGGCGCY